MVALNKEIELANQRKQYNDARWQVECLKNNLKCKVNPDLKTLYAFTMLEAALTAESDKINRVLNVLSKEGDTNDSK